MIIPYHRFQFTCRRCALLFALDVPEAKLCPLCGFAGVNRVYNCALTNPITRAGANTTATAISVVDTSTVDTPPIGTE